MVQSISTVHLSNRLGSFYCPYISYRTKYYFSYTFLVAASNQAGPHVEALAEIAKLARSKPFCKALVAAENARGVVESMKGE